MSINRGVKKFIALVLVRAGVAAAAATGVRRWQPPAHAADNGEGFMWDVQPQSWARRVCQIAGRVLSRNDWNDALPPRRPPVQPAELSGHGQTEHRMIRRDPTHFLIR